MGADHVIKVTTDDPKQVAMEIEQLLGEQPDVSVECSGVDFSFRTAIHVSRIVSIFWQFVFEQHHVKLSKRCTRNYILSNICKLSIYCVTGYHFFVVWLNCIYKTFMILSSKLYQCILV